MQEHRFSDGRDMTIATVHQQPGRKPAVPYDNLLRFNSIVDKKKDDISSIIYSIDAMEILKVLDAEQLEELAAITLACRTVRSGIGLWDTLFNNANRSSMNACIFTAQQDCTPIPQNRVVIASHYLNLGMPCTRIFLNEIVVGDTIGIGVYDLSKQTTYVLIYTVDEVCSVTAPAEGREGRPGSIPAINCRLLYVTRFGHDGVAKIIEFDEQTPYNPEQVTPFLTHITNAIYDVNKGYPWKPHFIDVPINTFVRAEVEERLLRFADKAISTTYEDFLDICRTAYQRAKPPKVQAVAAEQPQPPGNGRRRPKARGNQGRPLRPERYIPKVEIFSKGDHYFATLDDKSNPACEVYTFPISDLESEGVVEIFLTNRDLVGIDVVETQRAVLLSEDKFGRDAYMRYFEMGF